MKIYLLIVPFKKVLLGMIKGEWRSDKVIIIFPDFPETILTSKPLSFLMVKQEKNFLPL